MQDFLRGAQDSIQGCTGHYSGANRLNYFEARTGNFLRDAQDNYQGGAVNIIQKRADDVFKGHNQDF